MIDFQITICKMVGFWSVFSFNQTARISPKRYPGCLIYKYTKNYRHQEIGRGPLPVRTRNGTKKGKSC